MSKSLQMDKYKVTEQAAIDDGVTFIDGSVIEF